MTNFETHIIKRVNIGNVTQVAGIYSWLQNHTFSETFTYDASDQPFSLLFLCSPKEKKQKERALAAGEKNPVHNARQLAERRNRRCGRMQSQACLGYAEPRGEKDAKHLNSQHRSAPLPCYGRRIFSFTPQVGEIIYTNRGIQRLQQWQDATTSSEVPPCNLLFSFLCFVSFFFSGRRKKERNEGKTAYYGYNAANTRTYKLSFLNQNQWVNGQLVSLLFLCSPKEKKQKERAFAAVEKNPVHNARQLAERRNRRCGRMQSQACLGYAEPRGEKDAKHLNSQHRSAPLPCYGRRIFFITPQVCDMTLTTCEIQRLQQWQDATLSSEVPPCNLLFSVACGQVCLRSTESDRGRFLFSLSANSLCFVSFIFSGRRKKERNEGKNFYYHTNHLGSTAYVTDNNATITQGFLYAPFGEITTEYAPLWQNGTLPKYTFNAKELDEETGMYYYEARYYKPPVFTSRDPMFEKYFWMTPYAYCANNPVKYVDPDGRKIIIRHWVSDGDQDGEYKPGHLNKETAEQLENFAKTREGFAFLSQYATKGQKIGKLINACQSGCYTDYFKIVKEDAPNMDSQGDIDHRDYIIGKFGGIFNRYVSQLKKIMNSEQEIKTPV